MSRIPTEFFPTYSEDKGEYSRLSDRLGDIPQHSYDFEYDRERRHAFLQLLRENIEALKAEVGPTQFANADRMLVNKWWGGSVLFSATTPQGRFLELAHPLKQWGVADALLILIKETNSFWVRSLIETAALGFMFGNPDDATTHAESLPGVELLNASGRIDPRSLVGVSRTREYQTPTQIVTSEQTFDWAAAAANVEGLVGRQTGIAMTQIGSGALNFLSATQAIDFAGVTQMIIRLREDLARFTVQTSPGDFESDSSRYLIVRARNTADGTSFTAIFSLFLDETKPEGEPGTTYVFSSGEDPQVPGLLIFLPAAVEVPGVETSTEETFDWTDANETGLVGFWPVPLTLDNDRFQNVRYHAPEILPVGQDLAGARNLRVGFDMRTSGTNNVFVDIPGTGDGVEDVEDFDEEATRSFIIRVNTPNSGTFVGIFRLSDWAGTNDPYRFYITDTTQSGAVAIAAMDFFMAIPSDDWPDITVDFALVENSANWRQDGSNVVRGETTTTPTTYQYPAENVELDVALVEETAGWRVDGANVVRDITTLELPPTGTERYFLSDRLSLHVSAFAPDGAYDEMESFDLSSNLTLPIGGMDIHEDVLYVVSPRQNRYWEVTRAGSQLSTEVPSGGTNIDVTRTDDYVYVLKNNRRVSVRKFGTTEVRRADLPPEISSPAAITRDAAGNVYVLDIEKKKVFAFREPWMVRHEPLDFDLDASNAAPIAAGFDSVNSKLLVADAYSGKVYAYTPSVISATAQAAADVVDLENSVALSRNAGDTGRFLLSYKDRKSLLLGFSPHSTAVVAQCDVFTIRYPRFK